MSRTLLTLFCLALVLLPANTIAQVDWTLMTVPTTEDLNAVYVAAPDSAFAVGNNGTVLSFDGDVWTQMSFDTTLSLIDIAGFNASTVYALGGGIIYKLNGSSWAPMDPQPAAEFTPASLWASPWGTLYVPGFASSAPYGPGGYAYYDGVEWLYAVGLQQFSQGQQYIWGTASNNLFVLTGSTLRIGACGGVIGDFWGRKVSFGGTGQAIWGPGDNPGFYIATCCNTSSGVYYWDGASNLCTLSSMPRASANTNAVRAIWGSSDDNRFAVGQDRVFNQAWQNFPSIYRGAPGHQWTKMSTPIDGVSAGELRDVHGADSTHVFAVGRDGVILTLQPSVPSDTLVVNTTSDAPDIPGDDRCDTGEPLVDGKPACSLRAAIQYANLKPGPQVIVFDIPGTAPYRIVSDSSIVVTDSVTVEGATSDIPPASASAATAPAPIPLVIMDGSDVVDRSFVLAGGGCKLIGLAIVNYDSAGVLIRSDQNSIEGCYIGVSPFGGTDDGNNGSGIVIEAGWRNQIGGRIESSGNIISGNTGYGIEIHGITNFVEGNVIGLDPLGSGARPNDKGGVFIGFVGNFIGHMPDSPGTGRGNIISGNTNVGVEIAGESATGNKVTGNIIGAGPDGTTGIQNTGPGVRIHNGAAENEIGGVDPRARNIISGNGDHGIQIEGATTKANAIRGNYVGVAASGTAALANAGDGIFISDADSTLVEALNVLSGNTGSGIAITGASARKNVVRSNYIGLGADLSRAVPNEREGVAVTFGAHENQVGDGTNPGRNYIAGNRRYGVLILGATTIDNKVMGNFIGVTNDKRVPNEASGVRIIEAPHNIIGGDAPAKGNVISGNRGHGVWIQSAAADSVRVENNFIGVTVEPNFPDTLANDLSGVHVSDGATNAYIASNTISGNLGHGVYIAGGAGDANAARLVRNRIGLGVVADVAEPNRQDGVRVEDSRGNIIGSPQSLNGNIVSGNTLNGVTIQGANSSENRVLGNTIGAAADGQSAVPNERHGLELRGGATRNVIGPEDGSGLNVISGNKLSGIRIAGESTDSNLVVWNLIGTVRGGDAELPNEYYGVEIIDGASRNIIGGLGQSSVNLISGNRLSGVRINGPSTTLNRILGNYIGTDPSGASPLPNENGVSIDDAPGNDVGDVGGANVVSGNRNAGVLISGAPADSNRVRFNFIGTDKNGGCAVDGQGMCAMGNLSGVVVRNGADRTRIEDNLISGNRADGIKLEGSIAAKVRGSDICRNRVGVDDAGSAAVPNQRGVLLVGATRTLLERNLVSGNREEGVKITQGSGANADSTTLRANWIGVSGSAPRVALANGDEGILVAGALNTVIDSCVVSGNGGAGIKVAGGVVTRISSCFLGCNDDGSQPIPNSHGVWVEGPVSFVTIGGDKDAAGNVISGNRFAGILVKGAEATEIRMWGNVIGLKASGTERMPNSFAGVEVNGSSAVQIGSRFPALRNIISGNDGPGVLIWKAGATENKVVGNYIGTDKAGADAIPNEGGVRVAGANANLVGTAEPDGGNLLSGNRMYGVQIAGDADGPASENRVQNNLIGLKQGGSEPLANIGPGVVIKDAHDNTIGGSGPLERNIISGNAEHGVLLEQSDASAQTTRGNKVQNNYIGTDAAGMQAVPNTFDGIRIHSAKANLIGGNFGTEGNLISGNQGNGVNIRDSKLSSGANNRVQGNVIGWKADESSRLGNDGDGVLIYRSSASRIGGTSALRNHIANSLLSGVRLFEADATLVSLNRIKNNENGLYLEGGDGNWILDNQIRENECGIIGASAETTQNLLAMNQVVANTDQACTGIHLSSPGFTITGNYIADDAGNGISLDNGADPEVHQNNIVNNTLFGLNTDGSAAIDAQDNWWGSADGPGGAGPGSGDEVSTGVDYSNWRASMVSLVMALDIDTLIVPPGSIDSALVFLRNWASPGDAVDLAVSDDQGWVSSPGSETVVLNDSLGGDTSVEMSVPPGGTGTSTVRVQATSQSDPSDVATASFIVATYAPALSAVYLFPDTLRVAPRDTFQLVVEGYDQTGRPYAFVPVWTASGGSIDARNVYAAPDENGAYTIGVSDGAGVVADETYVIVDGVAPLDLTLGVLPNPFLSQFLDIFVVGSGQIDPPSLSLDVGGTPVPMVRTDSLESVWKADYEITGPGDITINVCASNPGGSSDCQSTTISAARALQGASLVVRSADGVMKIRVPASAVVRDGFVVVVPEESPDAATAFNVGAAGVIARDWVDIEFDIGQLNLSAGFDRTRLAIRLEDGEVRRTVIDPEANIARATTRGVGRIELVVGPQGTSRVVDPRFVQLGQNYPNPFNPTTSIPFELETSQRVELDIFDVAGRLVERLYDSAAPAGRSVVVWRGTTVKGGSAVSGVYFVRLRTDQTVVTRKLVLIR